MGSQGRAGPKPSYRLARTGEDVEQFYFESYSHLGIHQEMLQDRVRTETYRDAIFANRSKIEGKVVMDVGCGTGILSIFAAQAGAKKVYAVEAADIAEQAKQVVRLNNLESTITVLHGKIEEVEIDEKVDVIVSEWMGYMLLYENMLASVIFARDKWLKPDGIMLPQKAKLLAAALTNEERYDELLSFWDNVYGVNMSCMMPLAKKCFFSEPCIELISPENVMSWPVEILSLDCSKVSCQELAQVKASFSVKSMIMGHLHGITLWFSVEFPICREPARGELGADVSGDDVLLLSTAPEAPPTHWMQVLLYLDDPIPLQQDDEVAGDITIGQTQETARLLTVDLTYRVKEISGTKTFQMK